MRPHKMGLKYHLKWARNEEQETIHTIDQVLAQSNLATRNSLIRNKLVLRNHFLWPICHLLHKDKELLALRNNFRATKKFLIAKFDCTTKRSLYAGLGAYCLDWGFEHGESHSLHWWGKKWEEERPNYGIISYSETSGRRWAMFSLLIIFKWCFWLGLYS